MNPLAVFCGSFCLVFGLLDWSLFNVVLGAVVLATAYVFQG